MDRQIVKQALVYLPDFFADWEIAFILPEMREAGWEVTTFSETGKPLKSMAGLTVTPDLEITKVDFETAGLVILCGSDTWQDPIKNKSMEDLLPNLKQKGIFLAAICGATTAMARSGLLDQIHHTGNFLKFMKLQVPTYKGEALYRSDRLAVRDKKVITASGAGAVEFAYEIMQAMGIHDEARRNSWYLLNKHGVIPKAWHEYSP